MKHHALIALLLPLLAAAAYEPAPANIILPDAKPVENAWVDRETMEGVFFFLGDPKSDKKVAGTRKRGQYTRVDYIGEGDDPNYLRALALMRDNKPDAPDFFRKAAGTAKWQWVVEDSYVRAANGYARAKKSDDALAVLKEYTDKFPQSVRMAEVVQLRAGLLLAKGDKAGATKDYAEMEKQGPAWGPDTWQNGVIGQRDVLVADKKYAEAVEFLTARWAKVKPEAEGDAFAAIGLAIADDLKAGGKGAEGAATLKRLYLAPLSSEVQAKARLRHARILAEANDTKGNLAAFDQAAIAALLGADDETQAAAVKLAKELVQRIDKDQTVSNEDRKEYRSYQSGL
jgi:hypothetical protein